MTLSDALKQAWKIAKENKAMEDAATKASAERVLKNSFYNRFDKKIAGITGCWVKPIVKREYSEKFIKDAMYAMFRDNNFYIIQLDKHFKVMYPQRFREFIRNNLKDR